VCPLTLPAAGTACTRINLQCEYGEDVSPTCDPQARCIDGRWQIRAPGINCPTPNYGVGPGCLSSYSDAKKGGSCQKLSLECDYPEGRCACTSFGPILIDGGSGNWHCEQLQAGCPTKRPRLGSPCSLDANTNCDYGACFLQGGTVENCVSGVWQEALWGCPAGAGAK
jgi:hypothetical protein